MKNPELTKYADAGHFWWLTNAGVLSRRLRRRADAEQARGEGERIVHCGAMMIHARIYDVQRFAEAGTCQRRATGAALVFAALLLVLTLFPAEGLLYEVLAAAAGVAACLALMWLAAMVKFRHDPGLPAELAPGQVDEMAAWLRRLGEQGRPFIGVWGAIGMFALLAGESLVVFLLSRSLLFASLKPVHAMIASLALALASGLVLVEAVGFLAVAIRKGALRDLESQLAESSQPGHQARAALIRETYDAAVGGRWFRGHRMLGHWLRCYREALVIGLLLAVAFIATVVLRLLVAIDDPGELLALAVTAGIALATLLLAVKREVQACDLSEHVAQARRVVRCFPDGSALAVHRREVTERVRSRLLEVQLVMKNVWAPRVATHGPLQLDLLAMLGAELARLGQEEVKVAGQGTLPPPAGAAGWSD